MFRWILWLCLLVTEAIASDSLVMKWSHAGPDARYMVELSRDPQFNTIEKRFESSLPRMEWNPPDPGVYYWRVYSLAKHDLTKGELKRGRIVKQYPTLDIENRSDVVDQVPNGQVDRIPLTAELRWKELENVSFYQVEISMDSDFANPLRFEPEHSPLVAVLPAVGTYYWRVRAFKDFVEVAPFSDSDSFVVSRTELPTEPPGTPPPPPPPPTKQSLMVYLGYAYALQDAAQSLNTLNQSLKDGSGSGTLPAGGFLGLQFFRSFWGFGIHIAKIGGSVGFRSLQNGSGSSKVNKLEGHFLVYGRKFWNDSLSFYWGTGVSRQTVFWFAFDGATTFSAVSAQKLAWMNRLEAQWRRPGQKLRVIAGMDSDLGIKGFPGYWTVAPRLGLYLKVINFGLGFEYQYRPLVMKTGVLGNPGDVIRVENDEHRFMFKVGYELPWLHQD